MRATGRRIWRSAAALTLAISTLAVASAPSPAAAAVAGTTSYTALTPTRILDTRPGATQVGVQSGKVAAGQTITVPIETVASGVPAAATAVVFNLLALNAGPGWVTAFPADVAQPDTSSLNIDDSAQLVNNVVTVPLSGSGEVKIFASTATNLVIDVQGYFVPAAAATTGRLTPVTPVRLLDTRYSNPIKTGKLAAGSTLEVPVAQQGAFPADATAAVLNVTVTGTSKAGYWSMFPSGGAPTSSNLNPNGAGQTIANQVITRLSGGKVQVYTSGGGHLLIDLVGWITGPSASSSDDGLFVPLTPSRLLDTRQGGVSKPARNRTVQVPVEGRAGIPASGVGAVLLNATTTQTTKAGFFTAWPAQTYRPVASNLNAVKASQTLANHVITPVSEAGFSVYTSDGGQLLSDVAGWFTGTPITTTLPPAIQLVGPSGPPANSSYAVSGDRWDPCRGPIRYRLNLGPYGEAYRPMVLESIERAEAMTGLQFSYVGGSTFWPTYANPIGISNSSVQPSRPGSYDMLIALGNPGLSDFVGGGTVGLAYSYSSTYNPSHGWALVHSSIVVDMSAVAGQPDFGLTSPGAILQHEIAHALGLEHVGSATQIMYPVLGGAATYQLGDLNGLWRVRAGLGCGVGAASAGLSPAAEGPSVRVSAEPGRQ